MMGNKLNGARWRAGGLSLLVALAAACGGGGGSAQTAGIAGTGTTVAAASVAVGTITSFGSIFVNGVEFSTSGAAISVNGASATESTLRVGQVVRVGGTVAASGTTGTANTVSFDDNVKGPITAISAGTLTVMGQTVRAVPSTVFDDGSINPPTLATLAVNDIVEISGFVDSTGAILASRIERKAAGTELEVSGKITAVGPPASQLNIGTLIVNYASATNISGTPAVNSCVEARGTQFNASTNTLTATRIDVMSCGNGAQAGNSGEIEGLITTLNSAAGATVTDFNIGAQRVLTNAQTTFTGATAATLTLNMRVEVKGTFDSNGALTASNIEFKPEASLRVTGLVQALSVAANTVTILGVTVNVNAATQMQDNSSAQLRTFKLSDVVVGNYIEVRGSTGTATNSINALLFKRNNVDTRQELRAPVANGVKQANFALLGVAISTNGSTAYQGVSGSPTASNFFAQAVPGTTVNARCRDAGCPAAPAAAFIAEELAITSP